MKNNKATIIETEHKSGNNGGTNEMDSNSDRLTRLETKEENSATREDLQRMGRKLSRQFTKRLGKLAKQGNDRHLDLCQRMSKLTGMVTILIFFLGALNIPMVFVAIDYLNSNREQRESSSEPEIDVNEEIRAMPNQLEEQISQIENEHSENNQHSDDIAGIHSEVPPEQQSIPHRFGSSLSSIQTYSDSCLTLAMTTRI